MQIYSPTEAINPGLESRLRGRLALLVKQFSAQPDCSIPQATENRNDMDAAYQFFANDHVSPQAVLAYCLARVEQVP